jgi:hypothetical protein
VLEVPDIPAATVSPDHQHADLPAGSPAQQIYKHYLQVASFARTGTGTVTNVNRLLIRIQHFPSLI